MGIQLNPYIWKLTWEDVRKAIWKVNPEFAKLVDSIELPKGCEIFMVRYPYGEYLLEDGLLMVPNSKGEYVPLSDQSLPKELQTKLMYAPAIPMAMSLHKNIEICLQSGERPVPIAWATPGKIFALTGAIMPESCYDGAAKWTLTAGARHLFSTSKISEKRRHQKLNRAFSMGGHPPKGLYDQWHTFRSIAKNGLDEDAWYTDVLFFSEEWLSREKNFEALLLRNYLYDTAWIAFEYLRSGYLRDAIYSRLESQVNVKYDPNILSYTRHLLSMGASYNPGLSFNVGEDSFPKAFLERAYLDIYGLEYAPIFMSLKYLEHNSDDSVYYSLQVPMLLDFNRKIQSLQCKLDEMRDLSHSVKRMLKIIHNDPYLSSQPDFPISQGANRACYSFYHESVDVGHGILPTTLLPSADSILREGLSGFPSVGFCEHSRLFKGLVKVTSI